MHEIDTLLSSVGLKYESNFKSCKNYPQYKYFTIPIYKFCVNRIGTVAATGISFLAADIAIHQLAPQVVLCLASRVTPIDLRLEDFCNISYSFIATFAWAWFAIPVMYVKYKRN